MKRVSRTEGATKCRTIAAQFTTWPASIITKTSKLNVKSVRMTMLSMRL